MHGLDEATALTETGAGLWEGRTLDRYWNFAGPFGGYLAALTLNAVLKDGRRLGPPVAQTVNFCGALAKGTFRVETTLERGGKATQHWTARLMQDDAVVTTSSIVCANRRETFAHAATAKPAAPPPEAIAPLVPPEGFPWIGAYDFRFVEGGPVLDGQQPADGRLGSPRTVVWLRDKPERPLDYLSLASLSDCFILRLLQMRGTRVPMSTVSMTTYFHATEAELAGQGTAPLLGVADAKRFTANFHDQFMELWGSDGRLIATGVQTVWYRE
ncbi:MAG: thioesterase family protein [Hyphomicrobiaceae bacterium]|nr:thioesterase family protein [Hyphomicrobiaceae bacterium]